MRQRYKRHPRVHGVRGHGVWWLSCGGFDVRASSSPMLELHHTAHAQDPLLGRNTREGKLRVREAARSMHDVVLVWS